MKKLFVIAAAVIALAACTKTENVNTPEKAVSFQVANYTVGTKADAHGHTSLKDEGYTTFKTSGYFYTPGKSVQDFMIDEDVTYDGSKIWAPSSRTYYWPKTGYINFFSYAGTQTLVIAENDIHSSGNLTIATTDNILVADGAYRYSDNDQAEHKLDGVTEGVPMIFRHMLAKVKFDVVLDATEVTGTDAAKHHWDVTLNSASLNYINQGSLAVSFTDPGSTNNAQGSAVWTPSTGTNTLSKVTSTVNLSQDGGTKTATPVVFIAESTVLPQTLGDDVTFEMNYDLSYSYDNGTPIEEVVPVESKKLTVYAPAIAEWNMNTIYTYHITIKVGASDNKIYFDPAVEAWAEVENSEAVI